MNAMKGRPLHERMRAAAVSLRSIASMYEGRKSVSSMEVVETMRVISDGLAEFADQAEQMEMMFVQGRAGHDQCSRLGQKAGDRQRYSDGDAQ